jgi:hypothetical protein
MLFHSWQGAPGLLSMPNRFRLAYRQGWYRYQMQAKLWQTRLVIGLLIRWLVAGLSWYASGLSHFQVSQSELITWDRSVSVCLLASVAFQMFRHVKQMLTSSLPHAKPHLSLITYPNKSSSFQPLITICPLMCSFWNTFSLSFQPVIINCPQKYATQLH